MFEKLGFRQIFKTDYLLRYKNDSHGDGDYEYVEFSFIWKEYEHGYHDGYETKTYQPTSCDIELHKAITQQMKELGWLDEKV